MNDEIDGLTMFWQQWLTNNNIPQISADDLLREHHMDKYSVIKLDDHQLKVVETFCRLWDLVT